MQNLDTLISTLLDHEDLTVAKGMAAYQKNQFKFLGIKAPQRRELSRAWLRQAKLEVRQRYQEQVSPYIDWPMVRDLWALDFREAQYIAADYLKSVENYLLEEDLDQLQQFIVDKSWWDSVDVLVKRVGTLVHKYPSLKAQILTWSQAENIWLVRTSIIHQLGLKEGTDLTLLSKVIDNNLESQEFFINKAIGWALREYAKTDPEWVKKFVQERASKMSSLSQREALKNLA
ncbi:DNA alkylation repair protein [Ignavigranum ruoffiae]|uniref:DNA alkylation repair protein n=1 Tax=Ignavigranum ruoffiae TaxID=89093 RepID=UPI002062E9FD|nr:DNA alkylation repair protein [Ignavigranum ruoffiae]UPQ86396.1 DNA alkylation repair protein [Ignavigranum ruoffiae]